MIGKSKSQTFTLQAAPCSQPRILSMIVSPSSQENCTISISFYHRRQTLILCFLLFLTRACADHDGVKMAHIKPFDTQLQRCRDGDDTLGETNLATWKRALLCRDSTEHNVLLPNRKSRFRLWDKVFPSIVPREKSSTEENTTSRKNHGDSIPHHHEPLFNTSSTLLESYHSHRRHPQDKDIILSLPGSMLSSLAISFTRHVTPERLLRMSFTGLQIGILVYLVKTIWTAVGDVLDELEQEASSSFSSSSRFKEDHDLPFISEDCVDSIPWILTNNTATRNLQKNGKRGSLRHSHATITTTTTANLAMRLHAAGIPLNSSLTTTTSTSHMSVQSILKSLTRTEGQLLLNTLLSPIDFQQAGIIQLGTTEQQRNQIMNKWDEIGGLDDVKESLLDLVFPMLMLKQQITLKNDSSRQHHRRSYYGGLLSNPPGVLLYGPPGCGKTMLVRALAHTANARFLYVTPSTLLRKYVGETNLYVRALFSLARKISPCIIFIDEMEGLFRERGGAFSSGGEEHEVSRELKTEFMQLWDGIMSGEQNEHILVVGATNRPFDVDAAFLRRMPRSFYVGLPDSSSRFKILKSMLADVPLADDFDVEKLAQATEQYSPSDMKEMLRTAALFPLREARAAMIQDSSSLHNFQSHIVPPLRPLAMDDVIKAMEKVQPTQFSASYRSALSDYVKRASGGRQNEDNLSTRSQRQLSPNIMQPFSDGSFFTHVSTTESNSKTDEDSMERNDVQSGEEDSYSSSFDDEEE